MQTHDLAHPLIAKEKLTDVSTLFIIGKEDGMYVSLQPWLEEKQGRHLVFVLQQEEELPWIAPPSHVDVYHLPCDQQELCKHLAWESVFLRSEVVVHPEARSEEIASLEKCLKESLLWVNLLASDYSDLGKKVIGNVFYNYAHVDGSIVFSSLKGSLATLPAILCGAGPSLEENTKILSRHCDHAWILAAGSAIRAMDAFSIPVHAGAAIDPDLSENFYWEKGPFKTPFFYQDRVSHSIVSSVEGDRIRVGPSGGYEIESWLSCVLGIDDIPFESGWTAGTFSVAIAASLGCNPIVLVGMDFAYSKEGNKYGSKALCQDTSGPLVEKENRKTQNDYIMAASWLEQFVKKHPDITFITCSSQALVIEGVKTMSLSQVEKEHLTKHEDVSSIFHAALQKAQKIKIAKDMLHAAFNVYKESWERSLDLCNKMIDFFEKTYPQDPRGKGEYILCEYDLYDELVYQKVIEPMWNTWKYVFARTVDLDSYQGKLHQLIFYKKILQEVRCEV